MFPPTFTQLACEALARSRETPAETYARAVRNGFINSKGEVTTLLGGDAEPEIELDEWGYPLHNVDLRMLPPWHPKKVANRDVTLNELPAAQPNVAPPAPLNPPETPTQSSEQVPPG